MQKYSMIGTGSDLSDTGAAAKVNPPAGPTESAELAAGPISIAGLCEPPTGPGAETSPEGSSNPAPVAGSTDSAASHPDNYVANPVVRISGIMEIGRDGKSSSITSWKPSFEVEKGFETSFEQIFQRVIWSGSRISWNGPTAGMYLATSSPASTHAGHCRYEG